MRRNFVISGQSNASGRGLVSEVPSYTNINRIWLFGNDYAWHQAPSEPIDSPTGQVDSVSAEDASGSSAAGAGFGLAFANRMADLFPDDEIGLVICAKGGRELNGFRRYWQRDTLYGSTLKRCMEAILAGPINGVVWWQGERDAQEQAMASAWGERMAHLVADTRVDLSDLSLPWVVARLNGIDGGTGPTGYPYWNTVRNAQDLLCAPNLKVVSTDGVTYQSDHVHCTTAGYVTLGVRFADAMYALMS